MRAVAPFCRAASGLFTGGCPFSATATALHIPARPAGVEIPVAFGSHEVTILVDAGTSPYRTRLAQGASGVRRSETEHMSAARAAAARLALSGEWLVVDNACAQRMT